MSIIVCWNSIPKNLMPTNCYQTSIFEVILNSLLFLSPTNITKALLKTSGAPGTRCQGRWSKSLPRCSASVLRSAASPQAPEGWQRRQRGGRLRSGVDPIKLIQTSSQTSDGKIKVHGKSWHEKSVALASGFYLVYVLVVSQVFPKRELRTCSDLCLPAWPQDGVNASQRVSHLMQIHVHKDIKGVDHIKAPMEFIWIWCIPLKQLEIHISMKFLEFLLGTLQHRLTDVETHQALHLISHLGSHTTTTAADLSSSLGGRQMWKQPLLEKKTWKNTRHRTEKVSWWGQIWSNESNLSRLSSVQDL